MKQSTTTVPHPELSVFDKLILSTSKQSVIENYEEEGGVYYWPVDSGD